MRTTILCWATLAFVTLAPGCKKKPPPTESTSSAAVEECPPNVCSEKCPRGSRQTCAAGACGYDPAYHIRQVVLGAGTFACALYANGEVWCAGKNVVAKVVGIGKATQIAAGVFHACALVTGSVWCWGRDGSGELGAHVDSSGGVGQMTATPVKVNRLDDAIAIEAGNSHSCAIKNDRSVVCWGGHPGEGLSDKAGARPIKGIANARDLELNLQNGRRSRLELTKRA